MIWAGVDPGKHGAVATIEPVGGSSGYSVTDSVVQVHSIPVIPASKGKGRDEYDLPGIRDLVEELLARGQLFFTVEKSQPLPAKMRGGIANFHRGTARGWEWLLVALRIPYQLVSPATWMRLMHAGTPGDDTKQRSKLAAQRLFPGVNLKRTDRSHVVDHNYAEALLLAEFGRRMHAWGHAPMHGGGSS